MRGLTTVKTFNLLGSHCTPHSSEHVKCSKSTQSPSDMHQIGLMMNEQLQTVDQPTNMALGFIASTDLQDDINENAPKDAWL